MMTNEQNDGQIDDSQDHGAGVSIVPAAGNEFGDDIRPEKPSKEITLQRLSAHSSWEDIVFGDEARAYEEPAAPSPGGHRAFSLVAMLAIAALVGAISGAGTTFGVGYFFKDDQAQIAMAERNRSIDDAISQVTSELATLKNSTETASKANSAKFAKLSDTLDKLKSAPDVTGSIATPAQPAPAPAAGAVQVGRLPVLDGWTLREVADGGATIEGRQGVFEVFAGDPLPGVGRVDAIRRQDGRWVVVTSRGLIVAR